jgi:transposase
VDNCYEAGRDGFWIQRALTAMGVSNRVVDSASIEVNRRARRAKTDRLDAIKLVQMLVRVCYGERRVWSEVRVPSVADEAARQVSRERTALTQEQTRLVNQIRGWLATWGCRLPGRRRGSWWTEVRDWAGAALPEAVQARLARAEARLAGLEAQIAEIEAAQQRTVATAAPTSAARQLVQLKGVATTSASVLLDEGLLWRQFQNRRQIGGLLGFAPTPYNSGDSEREQGISRAGTARLQAISIQLAWNWVRWQPQSRLTQWYLANVGKGTRARRIGIVALARKLVIALWRYVTIGVVPERGDLERRVGLDRSSAASHARCAYGPRRVAHQIDRHGEGTAAHVSGSRRHSLWGPRACVRARIEGEDWVTDPRRLRTRVRRPETAAIRVLDRPYRCTPAHRGEVWAACAGRCGEWAACSAELRSKAERRKSLRRGLDNGPQHRSHGDDATEATEPRHGATEPRRRRHGGRGATEPRMTTPRSHGDHGGHAAK